MRPLPLKGEVQRERLKPYFFGQLNFSSNELQRKKTSSKEVEITTSEVEKTSKVLSIRRM